MRGHMPASGGHDKLKLRRAKLGRDGRRGAMEFRPVVFPRRRFDLVEALAEIAHLGLLDGFTGGDAGLDPHLAAATAGMAPLTKIADVTWDHVDAAFCCLPHATTQETLARLPRHVKIVDLSADFRLRDVETYKEW